MYISTRNPSSQNLTHSNQISQTPFSFADHSNHYLTSIDPSKRLSSQVHSFPLNYHLNTPTKIQDQNNFNSGYMNEISKIQQINNKISRTTEEILNNKQKYKTSEINHHTVLKPTEEKKKKYFRQFVRYEPESGSLSKYNCGPEPIVVRADSKNQQSEGKRSRKSSVKINFLYENSPERKEVFLSTIQNAQKIQRDSVKSPRSSLHLSPPYNYHSTDLILTHNKNLSLNNDVKFIYETKSNYHKNEEYSNSRSTMSAYDLAKYSPKHKDEKLTQKENILKRTNSSYLQSEYLSKNNPNAETSLTKSKDVFYDMSEPPMKQKTTTKKQESIKSTTISYDQVKTQVKTSSIQKTVSQLKDKQSKLIAIVLIALAMMIFVMQLFS